MKIEQTNEKIEFAGTARKNLHRNEFYTEDKIDRLLVLLKETFGGFSKIVENNGSITILIKDDHTFDKFGSRKYNSMEYYQYANEAFDKFFKEYRVFIYSIFGPTNAELFYHINPSMLYSLQKIDNSLIITL